MNFHCNNFNFSTWFRNFVPFTVLRLEIVKIKYARIREWEDMLAIFWPSVIPFEKERYLKLLRQVINKKAKTFYENRE